MTHHLADAFLDDLVAKLDLEQKVRLLTGRDFWTTWPIDSAHRFTCIRERPCSRRWRRTSVPCADAITSSFGAFDKFKEEVKKAGVGRFGSGWAWVISGGNKLTVDFDKAGQKKVVDSFVEKT